MGFINKVSLAFRHARLRRSDAENAVQKRARAREGPLQKGTLPPNPPGAKIFESKLRFENVHPFIANLFLLLLHPFSTLSPLLFLSLHIPPHGIFFLTIEKLAPDTESMPTQVLQRFISLHT